MGVAFLYDCPEGIERLDTRVPFCGMVGEAGRRVAVALTAPCSGA